MTTPLIAGNWKMNGLARDLAQARAVADSLAETPARARVAICPPATLLGRMAEALRSLTSGSIVDLRTGLHSAGAHQNNDKEEQL